VLIYDGVFIGAHSRQRHGGALDSRHETLKDQAVAVLCDAFDDYPVMKYIIGRVDGGYDRYLHTLVNFFVMAGIWWQAPIWDVRDGGVPIAIAMLTLRGKR